MKNLLKYTSILVGLAIPVTSKASDIDCRLLVSEMYKHVSASTIYYQNPISATFVTVRGEAFYNTDVDITHPGAYTIYYNGNVEVSKKQPGGLHFSGRYIRNRGNGASDFRNYFPFGYSSANETVDIEITSNGYVLYGNLVDGKDQNVLTRPVYGLATCTDRGEMRGHFGNYEVLSGGFLITLTRMKGYSTAIH